MYFYSIGANSPSSSVRSQLANENFAGFESVEYYDGLVVVGTTVYIKKDFSMGWQHPTLAALAAKGYFVSWCETSRVNYLRRTRK